MNPWTDSTYWAVGTDAWADILTWDQCDSREEAEEFIRTELAGRGIVMTDDELATALHMDDEEPEWDISDDDTIYPEAEGYA